MQTPKSSDVLALCYQLFPGLSWVVLQDSDDLAVQYQKYSARLIRWDTHFELLIQENGAMAWCGFQRFQLIRSRNEQGQTYQQALTEMLTAWIEYCEDMASATQQPKP